MKRPKMNTTDPDMVASWAAMVRAGKRAQRIAEATGTPLVVVRNGRVIKVKVGAKASGKKAG